MVEGQHSVVVQFRHKRHSNDEQGVRQMEKIRS